MMEPDEFILEIVRRYQDARMLQCPDQKVRRGRSHSVSSVAEDLFAHYLISNDLNIEWVYVDQPMSILFSKGGKTSIYPDITIVQGGLVTAFLDLKMDLGWMRGGLGDLCRKYQDRVVKARGADCRFLDGQTKAPHEFRISKQLSYSVIIISGANINPVQLNKQLKQVEVLRPDVDAFVLCKRHPNQYGVAPEELVENLGINYAEFKRLTEKLNGW